MKVVSPVGEDFTPPEAKDPQRKPLSVERKANGEIVLHSVLPKGISIGQGKYGRCMIATKFFPAGSIMYRGYAALADTSNSDDKFTLVLYDAEGGAPLEEFHLDAVNSVKDYSDPTVYKRQIYGFDGFMNHSCNANVYCPPVDRMEDMLSYDAIAVLDIHPGDEIACDYASFDYECDGHEIPQCGCGAPNCRGEMKGFKGLPLEEKIRIMHLCDDDIINAFLRDNPEFVMLKTTVPEGISVKEPASPQKERHLVATRKFEAGEKVFTNHIQVFPKVDMVGKKYIVKINDRYMLMDPTEHMIHRTDYCEFLGFDSFMDHSCDPNIEQTYEGATTYHVHAIRTILPGEKITCDYHKLTNDAHNLESLPTIAFRCTCGAANCRGDIVA